MRSKLLALMLFSLVACTDDHRYAEEPVQPSEPPPAPAAAAAEGGAAISQKLSNETSEPETQVARKIYYEGQVDLETPEPSKVLAQAVSKVKAVGGYVELETTDTLVLHVPVARFLATFDDVQKLGKVLKKNLTGLDITEAYSDTTLRKQLIEASLKKLEQLLQNAKTASERLALLKEIGELKGRLEETEAILAALSHRAAYSRLTLTTVQPARAVASVMSRPIGAFSWIDDLKPDRKLGGFMGKRLELPTPSEFVVVPQDSYWLAESATQASFGATKIGNQPRGSSEFWVETLKARLKDRFRVQGVETQGKFQVVRLADLAGDGYRYDVAVLAEGDTLVVAEAVYPTGEDEKRFSSKVFAALNSYDGKGL